MAPDHVVVWLDYAQACVCRFDAARVSTEIVKTYARVQDREAGCAADTPLRKPLVARHFNDIALAVNDARAILIVGPGFERLDFLVHLQKHFPRIADRVVALETVDHPTETDIAPWARRHFLETEPLS